jgi:hypothetical protein
MPSRMRSTARRLSAALIAASVLVLGACGEGAPRTPTGTPTDPVEVCTRVGDVCRIDGARLGVCEARRQSAAEGRCEGEGCFACAPQH